jgi:hypothetical protein
MLGNSHRISETDCTVWLPLLFSNPLLGLSHMNNDKSQYINDTFSCVHALKSRHHRHMNIIHIFVCVYVCVSVCARTCTYIHTYIFLSPISAHFMIKVFWDAMKCSTSRSGCGSEEKNLYHCQETNTSCPVCSLIAILSTRDHDNRTQNLE